MFKWSGKVGLRKVLISCNNKHCTPRDCLTIVVPHFINRWRKNCNPLFQWFSTAGTFTIKHYKSQKRIRKCIQTTYFSRTKRHEIFFTGTTKNIHRDKRLQKTFNLDLNQKKLRTTALHICISPSRTIVGVTENVNTKKTEK